MPPQYIGDTAKIENSMITEGSNISGEVDFSVIFSGVTIEEGAVVNYSILMPGTVVKSGAVVEYAIVDCNVCVGENAKVGGPLGEGKLTVVAKDVNVADGAVVSQGSIIEQDVK